jgi:hypothetical protein
VEQILADTDLATTKYAPAEVAEEADATVAAGSSAPLADSIAASVKKRHSNRPRDAND